jgi:hypothetical protein
MQAQGEPQGPVPTTPFSAVHVTGGARLPPRLLKVIGRMIRTPAGSPDRSSVKRIEVYGPGSESALVRASSGDLVPASPDRKAGFYLIVLHGRFVCESCSGPANAKPPHGTIETTVWSPVVGATDFGLSNRLRTAVPRLHRLAVIIPAELRA